MMWLFEMAVLPLLNAKTVNLIFALVCLAAALGADARKVALVSALLYLALVYV
ncbi:MAG: hypothetical protein GXP05_16365 [Alphaproteobacteria bacterium]|nr:hypothetical protein [Alphaproteobacteria bacterium]